jgi:dTDP-D-glucose 4,6-dehydratase
MKKNVKTFSLFLTLAIIIAVGAILTIRYFYIAREEQKSEQKYEFNGAWYTEEEILKLVPPQNINIPAKNTPEEAYTAFRKALFANDIEKALEYMTEDSREEYRSIFGDSEKLKEYKIIPDVGELIEEKQERYDNSASYIYYIDDMNMEDDIPYNIHFEKGLEGLWQLKSL